MSVSGAFVLAAALMLLAAAVAAIGEAKPGALIFAYLMLFFANVGFSQL